MRSKTSRLRPRPTAHEVLTKSPNPSMAQTVASSKGETKNVLARCAGWCSTQCSRPRTHSWSTASVAARASDIMHPTSILHPISYQPQAGVLAQREERLAPQVRAWITGDGKVIDLPGRYPRHIETHVDRLVRK